MGKSDKSLGLTEKECKYAIMMYLKMKQALTSPGITTVTVTMLPDGYLAADVIPDHQYSN